MKEFFKNISIIVVEVGEFGEAEEVPLVLEETQIVH
jgi:hypothetical protein